MSWTRPRWAHSRPAWWGCVLLFATAGLFWEESELLGAEEAPSWFVHRGAVEVHVCNVIAPRGKPPTTLSIFAPKAGAAWAREHGTGDCYLLPVKTVGIALDSRSVLWVQVDRRRYRSIQWDYISALQDTMFGMAVVPRWGPLKKVTGFALETPNGTYRLTMEDQLR